MPDLHRTASAIGPRIQISLSCRGCAALEIEGYNDSRDGRVERFYCGKNGRRQIGWRDGAMADLGTPSWCPALPTVTVEDPSGEAAVASIATPGIQSLSVRQRATDQMAFFNGDSTLWGTGRTAREAIGDAIIAHTEALGLTLDWPVRTKTGT